MKNLNFIIIILSILLKTGNVLCVESIFSVYYIHNVVTEGTNYIENMRSNRAMFRNNGCAVLLENVKTFIIFRYD